MHPGSSILDDSDRLQFRLLILAGTFLFLYSLILTLSPAARAGTWQVDYRWDHWLGFLVWGILFAIAHGQSVRRLPERDPYLLPIAAVLSGWGILTIWRLNPQFGLRQTIWLGISLAALVYILRLANDLGFLRRYKYLWLTAGLLLTGLTLLLGTNPSGGSLPRLWLGCCGVYFQPSEPLKLLLIVYLAAYLSASSGIGVARSPYSRGVPLLPLLAPTLIMTGLALLLLVFQRDLGTASVFIFLYALVVYIASGRRRILVVAVLALIFAGVAGYRLFDVVRVRIDAWLNPWLDASGRSYQVVQSLLAVANGGLFGRGPGLGSPSLVPVPHSDFIFVAIVEEAGLLGAIGLLLLLALLVSRGLRAAMHAPDAYRRYLAAGLTAYLVAQSILIIGGNLRLMPLTGVTLPFVSYGGSSLLTSFLTLTLLLHISSAAPTASGSVFSTVPGSTSEAGSSFNSDALEQARPAHLSVVTSEQNLALQSVAGLLWAGLALAALLAGWWGLYRAPDLLERTDNARRAIADRYVLRGSLFDRNNRHLVATLGRPGEYTRYSLYPDLSTVTGYTHPFYGQSGLEASLDPYLRGLQGYPAAAIWWNRLLYGLPPPGLDVRLSLDLRLQQAADGLLGGRKGALVLLDVASGDILVMASHPNFDPNRLEQTWNELVKDRNAPLFGRAALGQYQPGTSLAPLLLAAFFEQGGGQASLPPLPQDLSYELVEGAAQVRLGCALQPAPEDWASAVSAGCPAAVLSLARSMSEPGARNDLPPNGSLQILYQDLGLYSAPAIRLPTASSPSPSASVDLARAALGQDALRVSPLQMALAVSVLSSGGMRPAPRLVVAVDTPQAGWVVLPYSSQPARVFSVATARAAAQALAAGGAGKAGQAASPLPIWQSFARVPNGPQEVVTWVLAGTLPDWNGTPLALALLLEEDDPALAIEIVQSLIKTALQP